MSKSCSEAQEALVSLLNRLSREWIEFDTSNPTENTPLYLLCSTGMLEMHVSGRAWGSSTALDFEAWLVGLWIDATRRSILPDELRRAVPAWAGQAVAVQLAPRMRVRLTLDGKAAQDVVRQQGSAGFLEYICSRPVPGRVRVRIIGNQGPAPGAVHSDPLTVALTNWAEGAEAFAKVLMPSQQAVAQQAREQPEYVFRRDGGGWFIKGFGERGHFPGLVGLERLARLVKAAGRPVPMTELVSGGGPKKRVSVAEASAAGLAADGTSFEPLADEQAIKALEKEIEETVAVIRQAERVGDVTQAEIYRNQLAKLEGQYKAVTRPGGKLRGFRTEIDRLRPMIHDSIRTACDKLRSVGMKETAAHFEVSIRAEGDSFIYSPSPPILWQ
jgi:hypothetical protein